MHSRCEASAIVQDIPFVTSLHLPRSGENGENFLPCDCWKIVFLGPHLICYALADLVYRRHLQQNVPVAATVIDGENQPSQFRNVFVFVAGENRKPQPLPTPQELAHLGINGEAEVGIVLIGSQSDFGRWQDVFDRATSVVPLSDDTRPEVLFEAIFTMMIPEGADRPAPKKRAITRREEEVARLVVAGFSNDQIAQRLYLAVPTVKSHLQRIYKKLGVERRNQLISALPWIVATLQVFSDTDF